MSLRFDQFRGCSWVENDAIALEELFFDIFRARDKPQAPFSAADLRRWLADSPQLAAAIGALLKNLVADGRVIRVDTDRFRLTGATARGLKPKRTDETRGITLKSFDASASYDLLGFPLPNPNGPESTTLSLPGDVNVSESHGPADASGGEGHGSGGASQRRAYARIEIPAEVTAEKEVSLVAGIAEKPQANVSGDALPVPAAYPFDLRIQVVADAFRLRDGESWRTTVTATEADPYPSVTLHVTPIAPFENGTEDRVVAVLYSAQGRTIGVGSVKVTVLPPDAKADQSRAATAAGGVVTTVPDGEPPPDLTIRITTFEDQRGRLAWTFESPLFDTPHDPLTNNIGTSPDDFVAGLVRQVDALGAYDDVTREATMNGIATQIKLAMPRGFRDVWRAFADAVPAGAVPTVLILSDEGYVPWELAEVERGFDPDAPMMLGAQAEVSRWILSTGDEPPPTPPADLQIAPMVEVTAEYTGSRAKLQHAEDEGKTLRDSYGATHVDAKTGAIISCLRGTPDAAAMHLALHGTWSATNPVQGLIMVDGPVLTPTAIMGSRSKNRPLVFLNACQVGEGNEVLGQYAGMPAAFVYARARGVVAPLWSVDDELAKEIALRFYERLKNGDKPATILREERKRFAKQPGSTTYLSYIFFGGPTARLTPAAPAGNGG